jgi:hypothetical protein
LGGGQNNYILIEGISFKLWFLFCFCFFSCLANSYSQMPVFTYSAFDSTTNVATQNHIEYLDSIVFFDSIYRFQINSLDSIIHDGKLELRHPDYPDSAGVILYYSNIEYESDSSYYWYGYSKPLLEDTSFINGSLSLLVEGNNISGYFIVDEDEFEIRTLPGNEYILFKLSTVHDRMNCAIYFDSLFDPDSLDLPEFAAITEEASWEELCYVDIFVCASNAGNNRNPAAMMQVRHAIRDLNAALWNSRIFNLKFRIANPTLHVITNHQVFVESSPPDIDNDIEYIFNETFHVNVTPHLGFHRNENNADIVVILTKGEYFLSNGQVLGASATLNAETERAYVIVDINHISKDNTLIHEIAHIFGCRHEKCLGSNDHPSCQDYEDPDPGPYARAHKIGFWAGSFFWISTNWTEYRTIMHNSAINNKKSNFILNYSNPTVNHKGRPTGIANDRDNARLLRERACFVSDFVTESIDNNLRARIKGKHYICKCQVAYLLPQFIGAPPSGSINYTWEYSYDGINYQTLATSQNAEYFHNCFEEEPLSVMIRLTIQFSNPSYDPIIVHHKIEIVDEIDGIPCIEQQLVSINETSDYKDIELHIYPNPAISIIDFQVIKKNPTQDYQNLNAKIINLQYVPLFIESGR